MKNSILRIFFFLTIIILPPALWIGLEHLGSELYSYLQFDLGENRVLTTIDDPSALLTDGTLLTDYYADRAPFRNLFIKVNRKVNSKLEKPYENGIKPLAMKLYNRQEHGTSDVVASTEEEPGNQDAFNDLFGENQTEDGNASYDPSEETEDPSTDSTAGSQEEHNYEVYYCYPATCLYSGLYKYRCTICADTYEETVPRKTHDLVKNRDVEVSFETYGFEEYVCTICGQSLRKNLVDKLIDDSYLAPTIKQSEVIIGRSGWLFLAGDGNLPYYTRENVLTDEQMQEYADALAELNDVCNRLGKKFAVIIAPNKDQVYSEYMPSFALESPEKRTAKLVDYIKANTEVSISYIYSELNYADRYWQVYYKYDSHWNKMGAFIGEQSLLKLLGKEVTSPFSVRIIEEETDKVGDLISLGGLEYTDYPRETDYRVDYKPLVATQSLIEGNWDVMTFYQTASDANTDDKLVLIGDSYRINMIPYLSKDFSMCSFAYRDNIFEAETALADANMIVIESVERLDFKLIDTAKTLTEYLKQQIK